MGEIHAMKSSRKAEGTSLRAGKSPWKMTVFAGKIIEISWDSSAMAMRTPKGNSWHLLPRCAKLSPIKKRSDAVSNPRLISSNSTGIWPIAFMFHTSACESKRAGWSTAKWLVMVTKDVQVTKVVSTPLGAIIPKRRWSKSKMSNNCLNRHLRLVTFQLVDEPAPGSTRWGP